ncbi:acetylxylan esterase [Mucilaginibacter sp. RS28]|uniref:Acetylxylan esterase n=1 Tax=Mucilaginibacter straminoryzae TaxID=2932774 RepID=A0A9X2BBM8_9SPHI|nr:acetylxylan esterase [Mucilaginibacter straminoryzae]MCJ8211890.1 acetylxylan esterase [Mucilaginibacter straminoryzae]
MLLCGVRVDAQVFHQEDMEVTAHPEEKSGLFEGGKKVVYQVDIKNNLDERQKGKLGYTIISAQNKVVSQDAIDIDIRKKTSKSYTLSMPSQSAGFYKVNFSVNVTDYDDTVRRAFGVNVSKIASETAKPSDFDQFWNNAKDTLARQPMEAKVTLQPHMEQNDINCYLVEIKSYGGVTVRGWLTLPKDRGKRERLPVWVIFPGYGPEGIKPNFDSPNLAVFCFNFRGVGNSRDKIAPTKDTYLMYGAENRYKYLFRGVIMDCIRAIDFVASRPEIDANSILVSGASMGGYLSLVTASLDERVTLCSANNPVFSDYRTLLEDKEWPFRDYVTKFLVQKRVPIKRVMDNMDYYDLKNFVSKMKCRTLIGMGLLDNLSPPYTLYQAINNLKNKYKLFVYPELAHEVPKENYVYLSHWMMDEFGIF